MHMLQKKVQFNIGNKTHQLNSLVKEIKKNGVGITAKAGEVIDIPVLNSRKADDVKRILLVGTGSRSESDIRKAGVAIGRKVRATKSQVLSWIAKNERLKP